MARGEFASGEVLPSEKVLNYTFLFMENRIAKLVKYSFRDPADRLFSSESYGV